MLTHSQSRDLMKMFDHCETASRCFGMIMYRQLTALFLWKNAYEAESSAILPPKHAIYFVLKLIIFQKVESDTGENLGRPRSDVHHELNVTIVKSYFHPNKFG